MFPISLIIEGVPVSLQTRNKASKRAWKTKVSAVASAAMAGHTVSPQDVSFFVTHYFEVGGPDVDNIIKPLQDALVGIVYVDDGQVARTSGRRRGLGERYRILRADPDLLLAIAKGKDFVHIQVDLYVDDGDLAQ